MSDDFLSQAQAAWRAEPVDIAAMHQRLRRTRWAAHAVLAAELIGGCVAFGVGLVFFAVALRAHDLLFPLSAVMLLAGMPLTMSAALRIRRPSLKWEDATPRDVVVTALRRVDATLQMVRVSRWGVGAIAAFVATLWLAQAIGAVNAAWFLRIYTLAALAICAPYWLYLRHRERRAGHERDVCMRLLAELEPDQADAVDGAE